MCAGVTLPALRTLPKSGKQRVRGHVTDPTPVVTPPPCPKVGRRWRPRSVSQSEERVSLGDLSGRPWLGCVRLLYGGPASSASLDGVRL